MDRNPTETARKMALDGLDRLAAQLKAGRSDGLTDTLGAMSRFRKYFGITRS